MRPGLWIKRILPRTLIGRSVLILITPLIVVQCVATWAFYDRHWDIVTKRLAFAVAAEIALVIEGIRMFPGVENEEKIIRSAEIAGLRTSYARGAILPNTAPKIGTGILDKRLSVALRTQVRRPFHMETEGYGDWIRIKVQLAGGVLDVFVRARRLFSPTTYLFVSWMVGTSLVMFVIATVFLRNQVRPIRRLSIAVDDFGKGRDSGPLRPAGATEIRRLSVAFNQMRDRIQRMISQRTDMLAGVSHDLRTPITRMKLQLALMEDDRDIDDLRTDIAEMEALIEEYLAFAAGEGSEKMVPADLGPILGEVVDGARRNGADVTFAGCSGLVVPLRPNAIRRCLANVIGNATRHGEHVAVRAARNGQAIEIIIDDDGPGIPETAREDVFKPFFRLDSARSQAPRGTGLGLTIARDVIRGHGGDIRLEAAPEGGVRARLHVPV